MYTELHNKHNNSWKFMTGAVCCTFKATFGPVRIS
jgi:hypothetical protein